ncbi:MAG: hypothetical protein MJ252_19545, partial [archaeon]|nr:hypothetical protein [archaeon]
KAKQYAKEIIRFATIQSQIISDDCRKNIIEILEKEEYINKILYDSSKNLNDIGTPNDCKKFKFGFNDDDPPEIKEKIKNMKMEYIIFNIYSNNFASNFYMFGICVPNICKEEEFKDIFLVANRQNKFIEIPKEEYVHVEFLKRDEFSPIIFVKIIPILLIILILVCNIFPKFSYYLFYPIFIFIKTASKERKISECFNFSQNSEDFQLQLNSNNNDVSLSILNGVRGIMLVSIILSIACKEIIASPTRIYSEGLVIKFTDSINYVILSFGQIYGGRICYAISGFSLVFKLFNFLDRYLDLASDKEGDESSSMNNSINEENMLQFSNFNATKKATPFGKLFEDEEDKEGRPSELPEGLLNDNFDNEESKHLDDKNISMDEPENEDDLGKEITNKFTEEETNTKIALIEKYGLLSPANSDLLGLETNYGKYRNYLNFSILIHFYLGQTYKYLMFLFALIIYKYSLYDVIAMITAPPAPFLYFKSLLLKMTTKMFLTMMFMINNFNIKIYYPYGYFYFIVNELFAFIIFTPLLYFGFKKNFRLDMILIFLFLILFILKTVFILINNLDSVKEEERLHTYQFYLQNAYGDMYSNNFFFNITFPIIGMIFGIMHYSIEKGLKVRSNRRFAKILTDIKIYFKQVKLFQTIVCILSICIFLIMPFICHILIEKGKKPNDKIINMISGIGVDVAVLFFFLFLEAFYMLGRSKFFSHPLWNYLSKPYFSFLLIINFLPGLIFYNNESTLKLEAFYVYFFALIFLLICVLFQILFFLLIELPIKRINTLIIKEIEKSREKRLDSFI